MPTYEYRCTNDHTFELFQKMSDEPAATCPECGAAAERILSGGAGFLFKGEGFYITDYRSDEYRKKAAAESGEKGGEKGGGSGKSGESGGAGDAAGKSGSEGASASGSGGSTGGSSGKGGPAGGKERKKKKKGDG